MVVWCLLDWFEIFCGVVGEGCDVILVMFMYCGLIVGFGVVCCVVGR